MQGEAFEAPTPNGNTSRVGVILRTSNGHLYNCISGMIPNFSMLGVQLWAILIGSRRAFTEGASNVILETDNIQTFLAVKFDHLNQNLDYTDLLNQILTRLRDPGWTCIFCFVYPQRNRVAHYISLLGGELFTILYIFFESIGAMGELMGLDMGLLSSSLKFQWNRRR